MYLRELILQASSTIKIKLKENKMQYDNTQILIFFDHHYSH